MLSIGFELLHQVHFGQAIYLLTNHLSWQIENAIRMTCVQHNKWVIEIELDQEELEYKYVIGNFEQIQQSKLTWERGPNRTLDLRKYRHRKTQKRICDIWEQRKIMFSVYEDLSTSMIILFRKYKDKVIMKKMKPKKNDSEKYRIYYCSCFYHLDELNKEIEISYYLVNKGDEFICKPLKILLTESTQRIRQQVQFAKIQL